MKKSTFDRLQVIEVEPLLAPTILITIDASGSVKQESLVKASESCKILLEETEKKHPTAKITIKLSGDPSITLVDPEMDKNLAVSNLDSLARETSRGDIEVNLKDIEEHTEATLNQINHVFVISDGGFDEKTSDILNSHYNVSVVNFDELDKLQSLVEKTVSGRIMPYLYKWNCVLERLEELKKLEKDPQEILDKLSELKPTKELSGSFKKIPTEKDWIKPKGTGESEPSNMSM